MNKLPKISIITVNFNKGEFIEETILSVINQNYKNVEYIIIDGASTDNSVEIIKRYEKYLYYWISEPDKGMTDALKKGFNKASGDILCWINSDDLFTEGALNKVIEIYNKTNFDVLHGATYLVDINKKILKKNYSYFSTYKSHNFGATVFNQPSTFWKKELYDRVGGVDLNFFITMDGDLFSRFLEVKNIKQIIVKNSFSLFRIHPGQSLSWSPEGRLEKELLQIRERSSYSIFDKFVFKTKLFKLYLIFKNIFISNVL